MRLLFLTALTIGFASATANAQTTTSQPIINPTATIVPGSDTTASVVGTTISGIGRTVAGTLEDNAIVRALNRLFGRTVTTPVQPGYSPLPQPSAYQSTNYVNSFKPAAPVMSTFGSSPTVIFPKQ